VQLCTPISCIVYDKLLKTLTIILNNPIFRVENVDERYIFGGKYLCNVKIQQIFTICNYFSPCASLLWPKYALKLLRLKGKHKRTKLFSVIIFYTISASGILM